MQVDDGSPDKGLACQDGLCVAPNDWLESDGEDANTGAVVGATN